MSEAGKYTSKNKKRALRKKAEKAARRQGPASAEINHVRVSPQKARLVIDSIRGLNLNIAVATLRATNKRLAPAIEKLLNSAAANAVNKSEADLDKLYVKEAYANEGPRQKRIRPAPMGRAYRYQRRTAHIVLTVAEKE